MGVTANRLICLRKRRVTIVLDRQKPSLYNARRSPCLRLPARPGAQVAQLVEHVTENHGVGGSIPPLGTTNFNRR